MTTTVKLIAMSLFLSTTAIGNAQYTTISNEYAEVAELKNYERTTSEKITKEVDKILKLTEELASADEKRERAIKRKIAESQNRITELTDVLSAEAVNSVNYTKFDKYNFDVFDKSLVMNKFEVARDGDTKNFDLMFETASPGKARVDIVSPGGILLKSVFISNYNGKARKQIDLSSEKGQVYFIHIQVDGKAVTNKVRFN